MRGDRVERDLAEVPDGGGPPAGWEARVLATARMATLSRPQRRPPLAFALAGAGAVVLASILLFALRPAPTERKEEKAAAGHATAIEQQLEATQRAYDKLNAEKDAELQKLLKAQTERERLLAQRALDKKNAEIMAKQQALEGLRAKARQVGAGKRPVKENNAVLAKCDPNDPLCGL